MGAAKPPASTFAPIDGGRVRGLGAGFKALQRLHAVRFDNRTANDR